MAKKYTGRTWVAITPDMEKCVVEYADERWYGNESAAARELIGIGLAVVNQRKLDEAKND